MFHSQVTHVLVSCVDHPDATISLEQRAPCLFNFQTVWMIARDILVAGCASLFVHRVAIVEDDFATVRPQEFDPADAPGDSRQVWPSPFRQQPRPREARDDDHGERRPRPKTKTKAVVILPSGMLDLLGNPVGAALPPGRRRRLPGGIPPAPGGRRRGEPRPDRRTSSQLGK
jgi:hypothetical protein